MSIVAREEQKSLRKQCVLTQAASQRYKPEELVGEGAESLLSDLMAMKLNCPSRYQYMYIIRK